MTKYIGENTQVIGTLDVSGIARLASGITLSGGADILSAYVVDVWSPVLSFGGASLGIAYTVQAGNYTKFGNIVAASCDISLSSKGSSTGVAAVSLPFAAKAGTYAVAALEWISMATAFVSGTVEIVGNSNLARINGLTVAAIQSTSQMTNANFSNTSIIRFTAWYLV